MESWSAPAVPDVPGEGVEPRLFDTASGRVRDLEAGPVATMYVCGITPYDTTHLGHAATYLALGFGIDPARSRHIAALRDHTRG